MGSTPRSDEPTSFAPISAAAAAALCEEGQLVEVSEAEAQELLGDDVIIARYKIEISFFDDRTINGPNLGNLVVFESGGNPDGEGDVPMFFCGYENCREPISANLMIGDWFVICPKCRRKQYRPQANYATPDDEEAKARLQAPFCREIIIFRLTTDKVADLVEGIFWQLKGACDIYMKHHPIDIRKARREADGNPDVLTVARVKREYALYQLKAILKDGGEFRTRLLSFLRGG